MRRQDNGGSLILRAGALDAATVLCVFLDEEGDVFYGSRAAGERHPAGVQSHGLLRRAKHVPTGGDRPAAPGSQGGSRDRPTLFWKEAMEKGAWCVFHSGTIRGTPSTACSRAARRSSIPPKRSWEERST